MPYEVRRDTSNYRPRLHILGHHCSGSHNGIVAYRHSLQDCSVRSYPHITSKYYRCGVCGGTVFGDKSVVQCCKHHIMSNLTPVTKRHSAMVLKMTAGIYENILPDVYVFPEVSIERRENPQRIAYLVAKQF